MGVAILDQLGQAQGATESSWPRPHNHYVYFKGFPFGVRHVQRSPNRVGTRVACRATSQVPIQNLSRHAPVGSSGKDEDRLPDRAAPGDRGITAAGWRAAA